MSAAILLYLIFIVFNFNIYIQSYKNPSINYFTTSWRSYEY